MKNIIYTTLYLFLVFPSISLSALESLDSDDLSNISGEAGITIDLRYQSTQDIAYTPDGDNYKLLSGNSNLDLIANNIKVDVASSIYGINRDSIIVSLPESISVKNFSTGELILSLDNTPYNRTDPNLPAPSKKFFQLVVTTPNDPAQFPNLRDNDVTVVMWDAGGTPTNEFIGNTAKARVEGWDSPNSDDIMQTCAGFNQNVNASDNNAFSGCNPTGNNSLAENSAFDLNSRYMRFRTKFGAETSGNNLRPVDGLDKILDPNIANGAFGSPNNTPGVRDTRISFSLEKETEMRFYADNTTCFRGWGAGGSGDCKYIIGGEQTALQPALVLLDANGDVIDFDTSGGGGNECSDAPLIPGACNDDTDKINKALLSAVIGDKFSEDVPDRSLGGFVLGAPPEETNPIPGVTEHISNPALNTDRGSIQLGGRVAVFGLN